MKKVTLLFFLFAIIHTPIISQNCLPNGIVFNHQSQIDDFQANYPGCTEIGGNVSIEGDHITNLNGLNVITSIDGRLTIGNTSNLLNLNGLNNLVSVNYRITIWGNSGLVNLSGFENLASNHNDHLHIGYNTNLTDLSGLDNLNYIVGNLEINGNEDLLTMSGLDDLDSIGGHVEIENNDKLTDLYGLTNLKTIGEDLIITENPLLETLEGLDYLASIGRKLRIWENPSLSSLSGIESLDSIGSGPDGGGFSITENDALISLNGLEGLVSVGGSLGSSVVFAIVGNDNLQNLSGLENLTSLYDTTNINTNPPNIYIVDNIQLNSLTAIENIDATTIGGLMIDGNTSLSECAILSICNYLEIPYSSTLIINNSNGCNTRQEVEDDCVHVITYENIRGNEISIYPNPATDKLHITCNNGLKIETVNIYNHLGQKVLHRNEIRENIDISKLGQGIYIIELSSNELKIRQKLIIEK